MYVRSSVPHTGSISLAHVTLSMVLHMTVKGSELVACDVRILIKLVVWLVVSLVDIVLGRDVTDASDE